MRNNFDMQLEKLNDELIEMGAMCEDAISCAVKAMETNDVRLCEKVSSAEQRIDSMEDTIQALCLKLLLEQQPVARDLRNISSALKMITDMERIGDQAADITDIVKCTDLTKYINMEDISHMAESAIRMVTNSIDAFVRKDLDLAEKVVESDDIVDNLFNKVKSDVIGMISDRSNDAEQEVDILMIAKYLERIADHATNIAEWVSFSITGERYQSKNQ